MDLHKLDVQPYDHYRQIKVWL